jgi:hypothetical protein
LIDLVIHIPNWNRFFLDNIRDSIVQDAYLTRLDGAALKDLVSRAFQAQLKNKDIVQTERGGFLAFFFTDIHALIGSPYRENAVRDIVYKVHDQDHFLVSDTLTYTCRKSGASIQENIYWTNDPNEVADIKWLRIWIKEPKRDEAETTRILLASEKDFGDTPNTETTKQIEQEFEAQGIPAGKVIKKPLAGHLEDGLTVIVDWEYLLKKDRFQYWRMAHLTKNFRLTLSFPDDYQIQEILFAAGKSNGESNTKAGFYSLGYNSWMLPRSGLAWKLTQKPQVSMTAAGS